MAPSAPRVRVHFFPAPTHDALPGERWKPPRAPKDLLEPAGTTSASPEHRQGPASSSPAHSPLILLAFLMKSSSLPLPRREEGTAAWRIATGLKVQGQTQEIPRQANEIKSKVMSRTVTESAPLPPAPPGCASGVSNADIKTQHQVLALGCPTARSCPRARALCHFSIGCGSVRFAPCSSRGPGPAIP